jgi:tetratricopeptide (TPR) repeat protein
MEEFVELVGRKDEMSLISFEGEVARFASRFPQIVLMAEKLIWEEMQPDAGFAILATVGTPAAYKALRHFALGQAGDDDVRMRALSMLSEAGEISPDETLRIWRRGEWQEIQTRQYEISDEPDVEYTHQVADLLNRGLDAFRQGDEEQAEVLLRRALELEPRAKEGYNNLGALYHQRGDFAQAKEMFQAAIEIEPLYAFPRCNLAAYLLEDEDVEGAKAMLAPLAGAMHFHSQEAAFYFYTQARIAGQEQEYEAARNALLAALDIMPEYEPAQELLVHLNLISRMQTGMDSYFGRMHKRDRAWRTRLQSKLSTPEPLLSEALSLYTKEALTGMGNVVLQWGGWSALRKADLVERIVGELSDAGNVARMVADLSGEERDALQQVLLCRGHMSWQDFDDRYGNDLEESRYWQWHEPKTTMGCLRLRGFLVETTVDSELLVAVPLELRPVLEGVLNSE